MHYSSSYCYTVLLCFFIHCNKTQPPPIDYGGLLVASNPFPVAAGDSWAIPGILGGRRVSSVVVLEHCTVDHIGGRK